MSSSNGTSSTLHIDGTSQASATNKPNLFIKKKPTVAVVGSRPLIRPYRKHGIDYNNPGKFDPPELQSTPGTAIAIPTSSSLTPVVPPPMTSTPFAFDNHTAESRAAQETPVTSSTLGSKRGAEISSTTNDGLTILRIKRKRHEEPLDTLGKTSKHMEGGTFFLLRRVSIL